MGGAPSVIDIYNSSSSTVDATNNYWNPFPPRVWDHVTTEPTVTAQLGFSAHAECTVSNPPQPTPIPIATPTLTQNLGDMPITIDIHRFDHLLGNLVDDYVAIDLGVLDIPHLTEVQIRAERERVAGLVGDFASDALLACNRDAFCEVHVSIMLVMKVLSADTSDPILTHRLLLEMLVEGEYRAYIPLIPAEFSGTHLGHRWVWLDEAVARQFYTACGTDSCQGDEVYDFLEYNQHPRIGNFFRDYFEVRRLQALAQTLSYWASREDDLSHSIEVILYPPFDWLNGVIPNDEPYGYGVDLRVEDPPALNERLNCNPDHFALISVTHTTNRVPAIVNILFGTVLLPDGTASCAYREGMTAAALQAIIAAQTPTATPQQ